uniref:Keratin, type I cytoskeletal 18-like n=1 Tax=Callorhinchus milii TaxID=7868 RepID=A0A4W3J551_CALMI
MGWDGVGWGGEWARRPRCQPINLTRASLQVRKGVYIRACGAPQVLTADLSIRFTGKTGEERRREERREKREGEKSPVQSPPSPPTHHHHPPITITHPSPISAANPKLKMSKVRSFSSKSSSGLCRGFSGASAMKLSFPSTATTSSYHLLSAATNGTLGLDEKETMQDLNKRLSKYLDMVHSLQTSNEQLEVKIKQLLAQKQYKGRDMSPMLAEAQSMRKKILDATLVNNRLLLEIDNTKLSADDFRMKFQGEAVIRQSVEADIDRLLQVKGEYEMSSATLTNEVEMLKDELQYLKKNHQEEVNIIKAQARNDQVEVEVDTVEGVDLSAIMADIRAKYEAVTKKNRDDAEAWYKEQMNTTTVEVQKNTQALDDAKAELNEKRQILQTLQMDLEGLSRQNMGLENIVVETEQRYGTQLQKILMVVSKLEGDLNQVNSDIMNQRREYEVLLKTKLTLEAEIAEYRRLLGGETSFRETVKTAVPPPPPREPTPPPSDIRIRKTVTVITVMEDEHGNVLDQKSEVEQFEEKQKN